MFCNGPVAWCSTKQPKALSSTKAEYIAAADCEKELQYIKSLLNELTDNGIQNVYLNIDNQSAITLIKTGQLNKRSKHIDVRYHFISEKVQDEFIKIQYKSSEEQVADILTKPLEKTKFNKHKNVLCDLWLENKYLNIFLILIYNNFSRLLENGGMTLKCCIN